jgi:hypothetical protein
MKVFLKTGFGYIKKDGVIIEKFELPVGEHEFPDGVDVVEVSTREELETVKVEYESTVEPLEFRLYRLRDEIIDKMLADEDFSDLKEQYKQLRALLQAR